MNRRALLACLPGLAVHLVRTAAGLAGGSGSLGILGLWGLWGGLLFLADRRETGGAGETLPDAPAAGRSRAALILLILAATVALGMVLEEGRSYFRYRLELETRLPGGLSLGVIMATLIFWEGGGVLRSPFRGSRRGRTADLSLSLAVFLLLGGAEFLGEPFYSLEILGGMAFGLLLFFRSLKELLARIPLLILPAETNRQA